MASYITQELFNMAAVTTAKITAASEHSIEFVAEELANDYREYQDQNLSEDIATASVKVTDFMQNALPLKSLVGNLTQIQFCIKHYSPDGKKKPRKLLRGTWFNKEKLELEDKVDQCVANVMTYHFLVINGSIPIAPKGWTVGG